MADPPVVPPDQINQSTESFDKYKATIEGVEGAFTTMAKEAQDAMNGILSYSKAILAAGSANANTTTLTKNQADAFALVTTQIVGASEAYRSLTSTNSRTFESQLNSVWKSVSAGKNSFGEAAQAALSFASSAGIPAEKMKAGILGAGGSIDKLTTFVGNQISTFTRSADNVVKLREEYFRLMGASGGLGAALERSGPGLKNVNLLVQEQMDKINGATKATGLAKEDIVKYYSELGKIPGALNEQIKTTQAAGGTLDSITARTRLAAATGRNFSEVTADATAALRAYNLTGKDALAFVSRMSELNQKFGMEFQDTQKYMTDTANAFRFIGNEAEGSAKMFNKLMTAFKETGLSAKASTELIQGITTQISHLSIAQKSFLSAQTGGPGGLVGGFQIEKMLREGKIDEVFDKMQTQMKRQFGRIVSIDEAAQSPQAAAQLVRQREMLKQGPLGQFAQTDDQAQRILDAFSKGTKIDVKELSKGQEGLDKNLATGKAWQDKTLSIFTSIDSTLESIRDSGAMVDAKLMERSVTGAATGKAGADIRRTLSTGQIEGEKQALGAIRRETRERPHDVSAVNVSRDIRQGGRVIRTVPSVATAGVGAVKETASSTTARTNRTGVAAPGDEAKHSGDYMDLFRRNKSESDAAAKRWAEAQNAKPDERLGTNKTVGSVNTDNKNSVLRPEAQDRATRAQRAAQMGSIKVEPITVKIIVDKDGRTTYESTQQVNAAMNLPTGGKTP